MQTNTIDELVPAVAYYRMSSDQQDGSIEQQRKEVQKIAGYNIIREYVDDGISGLKVRPEFQRMVFDSNRRDFQAVLTWDVARFGRMDAIDSAPYKQTLRMNGVHLHTSKQGRCDWNSTTGILIDAIHQGIANEYSKSLSADTIRGRIDRLEAGYWPNGDCPYGFDRLYIDNTGGTHLVGRTSKFRKARDWRVKLVENKAESDVVRRVFNEFVNLDISQRHIVERLNRDGILRPDGNPSRGWGRDAIKHMLTNKAYAGIACIGGASGRKLARKKVLNRAGKHEKAGSLPVIVDAETWNRTQAKLNAMKTGQDNSPKADRSSVLTGIIVCGHCGYVMHKRPIRQKDRRAYTVFVCQSSVNYPGMGCRQWSVREEDMIPLVMTELVKRVDRAVLEAAQPSLQADQPSPLVNLQSKLAALQAKIKRGNERYLEADDTLAAGLKATLNEWTAEEAEVRRSIEAQTRTVGELTEFATWWERAKGTLIEVIPGHAVYASDPGAAAKQWDESDDSAGIEIEANRLRSLLKEIGVRVTLHFRPLLVTSKGKPYYSARKFELDTAKLEAELPQPFTSDVPLHVSEGLTVTFPDAKVTPTRSPRSSTSTT